MKKLFCVAKILVFIGCVDYGLVALSGFEFSAVAKLISIFGNNDFSAFLLKVVYLAFAASAVLLLLAQLGKLGKGSCDKPAAAPPAE